MASATTCQQRSASTGRTTDSLRERYSAWLPLGIILIAALLLRSRYFGLPDVHVDEQFYLLVGDRLLHQGAIPYVDIWDRKPVGLFLLYALIRMAGGSGLVEYQLAATLFAAATAVLIAYWPSRLRTPFSGTAAGLFYLILLHKFSGYGGEAEVFLNLFTTSAAFIVARHFHQMDGAYKATPPSQLLFIGMAAMLLCGIALQIKPTSVFPGIFLGLALLWAGWKSDWALRRLFIAATLWVMVALLPTLLIVGWYAQAGLIDAFLFANIFSIAGREATDTAVVMDRFRSQILSIGLPVLGGLLLLGLQKKRDQPSPLQPETGFIIGWLIAGTIAFLSIGTFYNNYALILVPMACVVLSLVAHPRGAGWVGLAGMAVYAAYIFMADQKKVTQQKAAAPEIFRMSETVREKLNGQCLYVHRGLPIFYYLTDACLVSRFAFPDHMSQQSEAKALGVDILEETDRIIASRPGVIIYDETNSPFANQATNTRIEKALAQNYEPLTSTADGRFKAYSLRPHSDDARAGN